MLQLMIIFILDHLVDIFLRFFNLLRWLFGAWNVRKKIHKAQDAVLKYLVLSTTKRDRADCHRVKKKNKKNKKTPKKQNLQHYVKMAGN